MNYGRKGKQSFFFLFFGSWSGKTGGRHGLGALHKLHAMSTDVLKKRKRGGKKSAEVFQATLGIWGEKFTCRNKHQGVKQQIRKSLKFILRFFMALACPRFYTCVFFFFLNILLYNTRTQAECSKTWLALDGKWRLCLRRKDVLLSQWKKKTNMSPI